MIDAVLFDLFETLITESRTRPAGMASRAAELGCDRGAFRDLWRAARPVVITGQISFRQSLGDITTRLGSPWDDATCRMLSEERARIKAEAFAEIEPQMLAMLDDLRSRNIRLGVVSNCFAEDVLAWPRSAFATRFDCTVFSCEMGLAKPDTAIYREAVRRLDVDVSRTWFIGDGQDDELRGAEQAGLRVWKALWFLRKWPHFQDDADAAAESSVGTIGTVQEFVRLVERDARSGSNRRRSPG
jgi:HAD superfamily hydrolase (TIGR01509 family)